MYITGMCPEIQKELVKAKPQDIYDTFALAMVCEGQSAVVVENNKANGNLARTKGLLCSTT